MGGVRLGVFQRKGWITMNNVVKLKLKNKPRASRVTPKAADSRLIEACIAYSQSIAAHAATFRASPSDDYSTKSARPAISRATAALRAATKKATTAEGLNAKARIVPIIIDQAEGCFEQDEVNFLASFAAEVKAYLQPT